MGKNHRPDRLAEEIKKIISEMLINGVKDPRLTDNMVSVSGVTVSGDGSYATCYISILAFGKTDEVIDPKEISKVGREGMATTKIEDDVICGLNSAKGLFKKEISHNIKVRRLPELIFKIDKAIEYGEHIDSILSTIDFDSYHAVDPNEVSEEDE